MKANAIILGILSFILCSANLAQAQKSYKWMKRKCPAVTITDAGELMSTYNIELDKEKLNTEAKLKPELVSEIVNNCTEKSWTGGMADLDMRLDNKSTIQKLKAFKVAQVGKNYILIIPSKLNQGLPNNFSQQTDIFIVIGRDGVSVK